MSAPRKIWIADDAMRQMRFHGMVCIDPVTDAAIYHHDDVVRELVEALREIAETDPPSEIWNGPYGIRAIRMRARAALAKIAQEDRG